MMSRWARGRHRPPSISARYLRNGTVTYGTTRAARFAFRAE